MYTTNSKNIFVTYYSQTYYLRQRMYLRKPLCRTEISEYPASSPLKDLMKEHFCPDGCGLLQDDPTPTHSAQGLTEWFVYENDANHLHISQTQFN